MDHLGTVFVGKMADVSCLEVDEGDAIRAMMRRSTIRMSGYPRHAVP